MKIIIKEKEKENHIYCIDNTSILFVEIVKKFQTKEVLNKIYNKYGFDSIEYKNYISL